ncbi:MAG TPA: RodZ domain-containing protein [Gaiellaceae bacterium]|nr:RodZ domain-containing protein [Gaiellaceae bacterium]
MAKAVRIEAAQLKPAQQVALGALASGDATDLTRARYEELTGVSRSQAAYDLAELVEAGALLRIGAGRSTRYRLAPSSDSGRRRWTDDRIRAELSAFCSERATWPSAAEFRAAGRSDLYVAASRYGGIGFWAAELGFPRSERVRAPVRRRATVAIAAALVFALGAGAAVLALRVHRREATPVPPAKAKVTGIAGNAAVSFLDDVRSLRRARVAGAAQAAAARAAAPSSVTLILRASRGDSWISVRSAAGRLLAERVLARGTQVRLSAGAFRVRLGAAANVDLSAGGSRLHPLPSRAAVVVVTRRGTRVVEWAPAPVAAAPQLAASHVSPSPPPAPPQAAAPKPKPVKTASPPAPPAKALKESSTGSSWPTPLPSP